MHALNSTYPGSKLDIFTTEDRPAEKKHATMAVHALFVFPEPVTLFSDYNSFYTKLRAATKHLKRVGLFSVAPVDFCHSVAPNNCLALAILAGHDPVPSRNRDLLWNSWHAPPPPVSLPGSRLPTPPPLGAGYEAAVLDSCQPARPVLKPPPQPVVDPRPAPPQPVLDPRPAPLQPVLDPRLKPRPALPVLDPRPLSPNPGPTTFSRDFTPQPPSTILSPSFSVDRSPSPVSLSWKRHHNKPASQALAELLTEGFFRMDVGSWRPGQRMPDEWLAGVVLKKPTWLFQVIVRRASSPDRFYNVAPVTLQNAILDLLRVFCGPMADGWIYLKEASMEFVDALRHNENTFPFIENRFLAFNDTCRALLPVIRAFTTITVEPSEEFKGIGTKRGSSTALSPPSKAPRLSPQIISSMSQANKVRQAYSTLVSMNDLLHAMRPDSLCMVDWDYLVKATEELQRLSDEGATLCDELIKMSPDY